MAILCSVPDCFCFLKTLAHYTGAKEREIAYFLLKFNQPSTSGLKQGEGFHGDTKAALSFSDIHDFLARNTSDDSGKLFGSPAPVQLEPALHLVKNYPLLCTDDKNLMYLETLNYLLSISGTLLEKPEFQDSKDQGKKLIGILQIVALQWNNSLVMADNWARYRERVVNFLRGKFESDVWIVLRGLPFKESPYLNTKCPVFWGPWGWPI